MLPSDLQESYQTIVSEETANASDSSETVKSILQRLFGSVGQNIMLQTAVCVSSKCICQSTALNRTVFEDKTFMKIIIIKAIREEPLSNNHKKRQ